MKSFKLTTLCYIRKEGKVLMLYRNKKEHDLNEGKWVGIGGKFEEGETPDECLVREVYEETGLTLTKYHLHGVVTFLSDNWDNEYMFLYTGLDFKGTLKEDCPEGTLKWVDEEKVPGLKTWEGDQYFLVPLLEGREHINLRVRYEGDRLVEYTDSVALALQSGAGRI